MSPAAAKREAARLGVTFYWDRSLQLWALYGDQGAPEPLEATYWSPSLLRAFDAPSVVATMQQYTAPVTL